MAIVAACAVVLALVRWPTVAGVLAIAGLLANSYGKLGLQPCV
jgi:hypothetical protein